MADLEFVGLVSNEGFKNGKINKERNSDEKINGNDHGSRPAGGLWTNWFEQQRFRGG
jgi:hypothetical protein